MQEPDFLRTLSAHKLQCKAIFKSLNVQHDINVLNKLQKNKTTTIINIAVFHLSGSSKPIQMVLNYHSDHINLVEDKPSFEEKKNKKTDD